MRCYGTPIRAFLAALTAELSTGREILFSALRDRRRAFLEQHVPKDASGQVLSIAGRFALVAAAGELATRYGVTGWKPGDAEWGVGLCFRSWLDRRGGVGMREEETAIAQVRAFVEQHGSARFEPIGASLEQRIISRAGFKDHHEGAWEYFVLPEVWRQEVCRGCDPTQTAKALAARGLLVIGSDGKYSRSISLPGYKKMRLYHLRATIIGDPDTVEADTMSSDPDAGIPTLV
jgi:uncharacterized protein (DUF927 family)